MRLNDRARRWLPWLLLALAVLVTAAVYWPGITGGWVFDDYPNIVANSAIHITPGHSTLAAWVNSALSSPSSFLHRPLASLTFSLNWYFGGGDPMPFKITNIIIHLVNGVLLFCMLKALLQLWGMGWWQRGRADGNSFSPSPSPAGRRWPAGPDEDSELQAIAAEAGGPRETVPSPLPLSRSERGSSVDASQASPRIEDAAATRLALIVSAAWMLLPINLMAVLYVVQRMESLCQVFVLAGLWAYLHGRWMMLTATDARRDRRGLVLAVTGIVLGTLLGLTSKESAVLLPVFAFFAEWIVLRFARAPNAVAAEIGRRSPTWIGRIDQRLVWTYVCTLFVPAVLGFAWALRRATGVGAFSSRSFTLGQRLLTEPRVLVDYLHWTLFPNPLTLSLYHDEIVKSTGLLSPWTTLAAIIVLAALMVIAIWLRNRRPLVALGIAWFFAAQLLTATIISLELVYEQRMYFGSIGVLLVAGALLLGVRWKLALPTSSGLLGKIVLPIARGLLVAVALLSFAYATYQRAEEWSNPVTLAVKEADRHPTSPRANYTAGRELMIVAGYHPGKALELSKKYLLHAGALPDSSTLAEQAMIMLVDHDHQGDDATYWDAMTAKLRDQPTRQEDISALISLSNCYSADLCKFDLGRLQAAYQAALARPHPSARLNGAYADFARDILRDDAIAETYLARAVAGDPDESAYRIDLAVLYARHGQTRQALQQIDALRRMNVAGRLDRQINVLEQLTAQGKTSAAP